jgi:hypothetical protein
MKASWGEVSSFPHACGNTQRICYYFGAANGKETLRRSRKQSRVSRRVCIYYGYSGAIDTASIDYETVVSDYFCTNQLISQPSCFT